MQTVLSERFWKDPWVCRCLFYLHELYDKVVIAEAISEESLYE
jgi:hypothetical protein